MKPRRYVRREGKETGRKGIYTEQNRIQEAVLAELGRISRL